MKPSHPGQRLGTGLLLAMVTLTTGAAAAAGDPQVGKQKARMCATCHGIDGAAKLPHVPNIGGESPIYLEKQLKAFRSGVRRDPNMDVVSQGLSDEDIADLVAWYSSIEFSVSMPQ